MCAEKKKSAMGNSDAKQTPPPMPPAPTDALVEVRLSPIHGNGVFAREKIAAGTHIGNYAGELIDARETEARDATRRKTAPAEPVFIFQIDDEHFIDATRATCGNAARFINHSCEENCEARWNAAEKRMEIWTTKDVSAGAELFLDYGFGLVGFFEHPCHCGSKNCCGYIVAKPLRPTLLKKLARHRRRLHREKRP